MPMRRDFINDYFSFTSKERKGIIIILVVIFLIVLAPLFFGFFIKDKNYSHKDFEKEIAQLKVQQTDSSSRQIPKV